MTVKSLLSVWGDYSLRGDKYLIMFYLADNANDNGQGKKSIFDIVERSHCSNSEVIPLINELIHDKEITIWSYDEISKEFEYKINRIPGEIIFTIPKSECQLMRYEFNHQRTELFGLLIMRDGKVCSKCRTEDKLSIDHIIPINKGGNNELENLQILCRSCNSRKGIK